MKNLILIPLLGLALSALAQNEDTGPAGQRADEAGPEPDPQALELPPSRDPHEGLPQRENWIPLSFSEADLDGDGYLSAEESNAAFPPSVLLVDSDGDGMLSQAEVMDTIPDVEFETAAETPEGARIGEEEYRQLLVEITEIVEEVEGTEPRGTATPG